MDVRNVSRQARARWAGLGGKLGLAFAAIGFVLIVVAWNGAAGVDYTQGQIPYLISGGIGGLGLIVLGSALVLAESNRRDRVELERRLDELLLSMSRIGASAASAGNGHGDGHGELVVPGSVSFHRPECHLVGARQATALLPRDRAEEEGLEPCRVCSP